MFKVFRHSCWFPTRISRAWRTQVPASMMRCFAPVLDPSTLLVQACDTGQAIFKKAVELEHDADGDELRRAVAESPLQPFWIEGADSILFYTLTHRAFLWGSAKGTGFIISRLPTPHPSLIKWSAPCFVTISLSSLGLSFGSQTVESFTACMTSDVRMALSQQGRRRVRGLDAALNFGGLQHKADLIAVPTTSANTVGINRTSGVLVDLSFSSGCLEVDVSKNRMVYGPEVTAQQILHGVVEPPREMQPLYGSLNAVVSTVERVTPPQLTRSSLERMTAGFDPDRRIVLPNGTLVREELREAPKDK